MVILIYWGIPTSFTTLEVHENDIPIEMFSSSTPLESEVLPNSFLPPPLESEVLPNSFLPPPLVSNVGLIDMIIDH